MAAEKLSEPNPSPASPQRRASPLYRVLILPAAAVMAGALLIAHPLGTRADDAKPPSGPVAAAPAPVAPRATAPAGVTPLPRSAPTRLTIPSIDVNAPFTPLDIGPSGQLNAPPVDNTNLVGWYRGGATPGERGTAIVAGHVDTKTGPAVFLLLRTVKKGDAVHITRQDGTIVTFKVDSVETFSKADFPNDRVYADTPDPQLRLITCGGNYDKKAKDYEDNVDVFAHLDSVKRT
jgi:LPXTG-site transpeptidase (sortase) family protein